MSLAVFANTKNATRSELKEHNFKINIGINKCSFNQGKKRRRRSENNGNNRERSISESVIEVLTHLFCVSSLKRNEASQNEDGFGANNFQSSNSYGKDSKSDLQSDGAAGDAGAAGDDDDDDDDDTRGSYENDGNADDLSPEIVIPVITTTLNPFSSFFFSIFSI